MNREPLKDWKRPGTCSTHLRAEAGTGQMRAQRSTMREMLRAVASVGSWAWRLHRNNDIALFAPRFDIPVRVSNLFQRVGAVNDWFQPACLAQL